MYYDIKHIPKRPYGEIRRDLLNLDLLFCSGESTVSWTIRKLSNSPFSHVGLLFRIEDRILVFEAVEDEGIRLIPLSRYLNDFDHTGRPYPGQVFLARLTYDFRSGDFNKILDRALSWLGRQYGKNEIAELMARLALGRAFQPEPGVFLSSELLQDCLESIGISFLDQSQVGLVTPESIARDPRVVFDCKLC